MKKIIIKLILRAISRLPLTVIRGLGRIIGVIALKFSNKSAKRLPYNLLITGLAKPNNLKTMTKDTAANLGMTLTEAALIGWNKNRTLINKIFKIDQAKFEYLASLLENKTPIVFLTPHIGNFEIAVKYFVYNLRMDLKILYKPSKDSVIEELMYQGRREANLEPLPTTRSGVLGLIKHLKNGGAVGILPDNVASSGDGEWVKFFGQDVYATSLAAKLALIPNAQVVLVGSYRTRDGFDCDLVFFKPRSQIIAEIMQEIYAEIELMVRRAPTQYYWSYDRFRIPDRAKAKPEKTVSECNHA